MHSSSSQEHIRIHDPNKIKLWKWMIKYASFIYKHPYVPIITSLVTFGALLTWLLCSYGVHAYGNTNYYRWSGDDITGRWDAYVGAGKENYGSILGMLGAAIPLPKQFQMTQMGCVIYERPNQNILEAEVLKEVWRIEDEMHATPGWADYCFHVPMDSLPSFMQGVVRGILESLKDILSALEEDTLCIAFKSIITEIKIYMQNTWNITDPTADDLTQEIVTDFINRDYQEQLRIIGTYIGNDFDNGTNSTIGIPYSTRLRSMFPFALPIKGYKNKADRQTEQEDKLGRWQLDFIEPTLRRQKKKNRLPSGMIPYAAFPFALTYQISDLILKQVWWLVGSFAFLFFFSIFVMKSVFVAILGAIGVFFPIPCALVTLNGVFQIKHVDVIDVIALFLICGIGADCLFIVYELFRQARTIYGYHNKRRLAYAAQRGLIALATSISASGVSFLALLTSGVRIMNFFGIFSFLLLLFTFFFTFTWYLAIIAIWAAKWEKHDQKDVPDENELRTQQISSTSSTIMYTDTSSDAQNDEPVDYPHKGVFDFLFMKPIFNVDAAGIDIEKYNFYEKFFYNKLSSIIYFYRFPIVVFFLVLSIIFGYFTFQMGTKSELSFLDPMSPLQRAYALALNGFSTALNDFSFVYVWGLEEKPDVKFSEYFTIDSYGSPRYIPIDVSDPKVQEHLRWTWQFLNNQTDFIDVVTTVNFGCSPWEKWEYLINITQSIESNPALKVLVDYVFYDLLDNFTEPPNDMNNITREQYNTYNLVWQAILSELAYEEPDSYVPGTLKANTVGFSYDNYSLMYIGMKANMFIPEEITKESLRELYNRAKSMEKAIQGRALEKGLKNFEGWMTGVAWLTMVTEEMLPKQVVKDVGCAFACAAAVILISTWSILYTVFVLYSMICTIFLIMGILYFTGWKIGTNEAIMISIASGFCADFIIQPMLAMSHDFSRRSLFGKIQASLTTFCTPVSSALITTLVAAAFLYPCEILLFPPFATFLLGSGIFGILQGFFVLPALIALLSPNKRKPLDINFQFGQNNPIVTYDQNEDQDEIIPPSEEPLIPQNSQE
ncbi:hypothetical protein TRFO_06268 [Tritrichomonas foetus]|uniref:SSD domain-containing protein n=1 Tax=Tritrichomonas foetus TaxID=1144522 RepID=A0A1J4JZI8_9EUKA|nr:hypothetical protein TRFO_06268 [Tritrichomonas foetus]|eukprot:OHT04395.1 hypothetical protein TRFO_06268 [Tritrichomonas foetus]